MAMRGIESQDWAWFTFSRVRVLRELADGRSERDAAERLGIAYSSVRSVVEELKNKTGLHSVREIGRWWRGQAGEWLAWCAEQAGAAQKGYGTGGD
ncbi:MAG: hypothetical protein IPN07_12315 [Dehalococcoidia bacterium]|nr:hypothetical protein [Dehalococcoidia bacterium]